MVNKEFIVAGIRNLLKRNYGITYDVIDVVAEVDATLTFGENWNAIKDKYGISKPTFVKQKDENTDYFPEKFEEIIFENNDVDTDRGTLRDRSFLICFNNSTIVLSEDDFNALTHAMKGYVKAMEDEETICRELEQDYAHQNDGRKIKHEKKQTNK